jgi:hypothetical protein
MVLITCKAFNYICLMKNILLFTGLLILCCCKPQPKTESLVLQKVLAYHDPENNWPQLKTRLYLSSTDTAGQANTFEIEMDNATGYFCHISRQDGKEVVKGMAAGKPFYLLDGKPEISEEDRKTYNLTPEALKWVHSFYGYLYGLPMKLTDEGTKVPETDTEAEIEGKTYRMIPVTYNATVGKDNWFFYLHPQTYALQAYRFNHGDPESGEYILLDQEVTVQGIKIPKVRKWYLNKNKKYLGTDTLLKAEPLTSYRI